MIRGIRRLLDSVTILYDLAVILVMYGAVALAELAARCTTAGEQYHWTALLAPEGMKRGLVRLRAAPSNAY